MDEISVTQLTKTISDSIRKQIQAGRLTLANALQLLESGEAYARSIGVKVVLTIVDSGGNLIAEHRMDGAILASIELSKEKAYTAVALHTSTEAIAKEIQPGRSLYGLQNSCQGRFCVFGGGIPLVENEECIGAVGVSGGTTSQDISVAKHMVTCFYTSK